MKGAARIHAFTLVELLISVALLAVIMTMALGIVRGSASFLVHSENRSLLTDSVRNFREIMPTILAGANKDNIEKIIESGGRSVIFTAFSVKSSGLAENKINCWLVARGDRKLSTLIGDNDGSGIVNANDISDVIINEETNLKNLNAFFNLGTSADNLGRDEKFELTEDGQEIVIGNYQLPILPNSNSCLAPAQLKDGQARSLYLGRINSEMVIIDSLEFTYVSEDSIGTGATFLRTKAVFKEATRSRRILNVPLGQIEVLTGFALGL